jgi:formiminoglutamase
VKRIAGGNFVLRVSPATFYRYLGKQVDIDNKPIGFIMSEDPRLRDLFGTGPAENDALQLISFPSDAGVRINGGRPGASRAPEQILEQLLKMTPHASHVRQHIHVLESVGTNRVISCSGNVEEDQARLGKEVSLLVNNQTIPVILGGGHETSYGHFLGYAESQTPVHIINIDAHTDVRAFKGGKAHSGSPFRQAIEHSSGMCKSYNVFGLNPAAVSSDHLAFAEQHGEAVFEQSTTLLRVVDLLNRLDNEPVMATMDMDAVNQGDAPGVSAPNGAGISKELWLKLAFEFGKHSNVTSFDLCEVNPEFDRDHQTARLAALTIWNFLLGVALREKGV